MVSNKFEYPVFGYFLKLTGALNRLIAVFLLLFLCPIFGQGTQKKDLTAADYHLWSYLNADKISDKGNWISYSVIYQSGRDTLFVKNSKGTINYSFPEGNEGTFCGEKWFACINKEKELKIINLKNGKQEQIVNVKSYSYSADGKYVIILKQTSSAKKSLSVKALGTAVSFNIENCTDYSYNTTADAIAYGTESGNVQKLGILYLKDIPINMEITQSKSYSYNTIVWQESGRSIAFLQEPINNDADKTLTPTAVGYYRLFEKKLFTFNPDRQKDFPQHSEITSSSFSKLLIDASDTRIFFGVSKIQNPIPASDRSEVQIWNTADKYIYPAEKEIDGWNNVSKVAVWWPENDKFLNITDNVSPNMILTGDQQHVLTFDPRQNEPQSNYNAQLDFYITELNTRKKKLLLQKQSGDDGKTSVSPAGKYITYFNSGNWWVYNIVKDKHINLTKRLGVSFDEENYDWPEEPPAYGNPGWTANDENIIIYDRYDIWIIAPDGSSSVRLTNGRENQISYRLVIQYEEQDKKMNYNGFSSGIFDLDGLLFLKAKSSTSSGYWMWQKVTGLKPLVFKKMDISQLLVSERSSTYIYIEQNYDCPPRLMINAGGNQKPRVLFQSNPQHTNYKWGSSKLITYTNLEGKVLNGVLFYPAAYNPEHLYPMVVHIYEKQSSQLHNYVLPSLYNGTGFNITNFTTQGYFVLLPDIIYEIGNPGRSATDCVIAATKAAIAKESIDRTRIGLIGHSYGGYETDFIITQTNLFAAAVAGAAITDYNSSYLYVAWNISKPNFWHYEFGQLRMGKSLFDDFKGYLENSPIFHAENIKTPLLSWAGEEDRQVHYFQSIEFYLALRRLEKKHILLLYPNEDHILSSRTNQKHLTKAIEEWFASYLNNNSLPKLSTAAVLH